MAQTGLFDEEVTSAAQDAPTDRLTARFLEENRMVVISEEGGTLDCFFSFEEDGRGGYVLWHVGEGRGSTINFKSVSCCHAQYSTERAQEMLAMACDEVARQTGKSCVPRDEAASQPQAKAPADEVSDADTRHHMVYRGASIICPFCDRELRPDELQLHLDDYHDDEADRHSY